MWIEKTDNGKFKYFERYIDPYTEKAKRVSVTLNSESNQAKNQAQRILNEKINSKLETKNKSKLTVGELLDEWWDQYIKTVRKSSINSNAKVMKYIYANIELDTLIANADVKFFQKFINSLGQGYAYRKKFKSILNMSFNYALDMEYLTNNPLTRVTVPKPPKTLSNMSLIEDKYLEKEEVDKLLKVYYSAFQSYRTGQLAEFMYLTGLRVGEAISLTVDNFKEDEAMLEVHGTLDYSGGFKHAKKEIPKTQASYRVINLSNRAMYILREAIEDNKIRFNDYSSNSYIFIGKTGKPIQTNSFNNSLKHTNEKLGKDKINKAISSHIFRHSHISLLAELNVPIKAIMERVGHSDEKTTLQIYTHVTKKQKNDVAKKLNELGM